MQSGLLLVDKPTGMTSHDVVASVRRIASQKQVGHAGTLDPLATGLMVVLLGEATKLSDFLLNGDKSYKVRLHLGVKSDTGDRDGTILDRKVVDLTKEKIEAAVNSLAGEFMWPVPIYSAMKVQGEKLYDKARRGDDFTPPSKTMIFRKVELLKIEMPFIEVRLECSKGSFVRTWVEKLGEALGTYAMVDELRRLTSIPYSLDKAISLESFKASDEAAKFGAGHWVSLSETLQDWYPLKLDGMEEKLVKNGQLPHRLARYIEIEFGSMSLPGIKVLSRRTGGLIAILTQESKGYAIKRVFNN